MDRRGNRRYLGKAIKRTVEHDVFQTCTGIYSACGIVIDENTITAESSLSEVESDNLTCYRCRKRRGFKPEEYDGEWFYVDKADKGE
jgi:hypothetical protein